LRISIPYRPLENRSEGKWIEKEKGNRSKRGKGMRGRGKEDKREKEEGRGRNLSPIFLIKKSKQG
jgi:hypothetical protein